MGDSPEDAKKTFRDKIRDRFSSVKQKSSESLIKAQSKHSRQKHQNFALQNENAFDFFPRESQEDYIEKAMNDIDLEKKVKVISKQLKQKLKENDDFFLRTVPSITEDKAVESEKKQKSSDSIDDEIKSHDDQKESPNTKSNKQLKTALSYFDPEISISSHITPLIITKWNDKISNDFLFWDGTEKALGEFSAKPNPVYEGISQGKKPVCKKRNDHMKSLISHVKDPSDWLDSEGSIIMEDDPIRLVDNTMRYIKNKNVELLTIFSEPIYQKAITKHVPSIAAMSNCTNDIDISFDQFKFIHHPLFSIEHALAQKLIDLYNVYLSDQYSAKSQQLDEALISLRKAKRDRQNEILQNEDDDLKKVYRDHIFQKCVNDISKLKKARSKEAIQEKTVYKNIVLLWKFIKVIRKTLNYTNTSIVLEISKKKKNYEEERTKWGEMFEDELNDIKDHIKCEYTVLKSAYTKCKKKHSQSPSIDSTEKATKPTLTYDDDKTRKELYEEMCKCYWQPEEPLLLFNLKQNVDIVGTAVTSVSENKRRNLVNKTKIFLKIYVNGKFVCQTKDYQLSENFTVEMNEKYSVKLFERPSVMTLMIYEKTSFTSINKIAEVLLNMSNTHDSQKNKLLFEFTPKQEIYNYGVGLCKSIAVYVNSKHPQFINKMSSELEMDEELKFGGSIDVNVCSNFNGDYTEPNSNNHGALCNYFNIKHKINVDSLSHLFESLLDPNDPENAYLFTFYNKFLDKPMKSMHFYISGFLNFNFAKEDCLDTSKILGVFGTKNYIKNELKNVPVDSDFASTSSVDRYAKKPRESVLDNISSVTNVLDPIDLKRRSSLRYLQLINDHLLLQKKNFSSDKELSDLMTNFKYPGLRNITVDFLSPKRPLFYQTSQSNFIPKIRSAANDYNLRICILKAFQLPNRVDDAQSTTSDGDNYDVGIKLISLKPFVRVSCQGKNQKTSTAVGNNPTWNEQLSLNVKYNASSTISFNLFDEQIEDLSGDDRLENTTIHCQYSANWLSSLKISLTSVFYESKIEGTFLMYSPPELLGYKNSVDERFGKSQLPFDAMNKDVNLKQREGIYISMYLELFPRYLEIPEIACENFESNEMDFMIRYLRAFTENYVNQFPERKLSMLVLDTSGKNICITRFFQPLLPPQFADCIRNMFTNALQFEESISSRNSTPNRRKSIKTLQEKDDIGTKSIKSSSTNMGDTRSHTRTVKKFELDSLDENLKDESDDSIYYKMQFCIRFVSMIPLFETNFSDHSLVLSGVQTLRLACGSMIDHTILLMNYFLQLGIDCWFISGYALPRGLSTYVLLRENLVTHQIGLKKESYKLKTLTLKVKNNWKYHLYDATTGLKYDTKDSFCPLQKVHYVCNDENIWVNIQPAERCDLIRFNLSDTSDWRPVFQKGGRVTCPAALPGVLSYVSSEDPLYVYNTQEALLLRQTIEDKIKVKIQKWRGHRRTVWNRHCSGVMRNVLCHWEKWHLCPPTKPKPGYSHHLQQLLLSYKIYGFPLNMKYSSQGEIISTVKATQIHLDEHSGIEFSLGVEVFPYPNTVYSVWVYLASVLRR